ncbi:hypothetical protein [Parasphingorhabdus pacifica]
MPKFLKLVLVLLLCAIGIAPLAIAPGVAESHGLERSTGSTIGALITMVWFGLMWWVSYKITRWQARRELGAEVNRLLEPYRDADGGNTDQGKHEQ